MNDNHDLRTVEPMGGEGLEPAHLVTTHDFKQPEAPNSADLAGTLSAKSPPGVSDRSNVAIPKKTAPVVVVGTDQQSPRLAQTERSAPLDRRSRRYGPRKGTKFDRLNYFVRRGDPDECWPNGYGRLTVDRVRCIAAHRIALEQAIGPLPPGAVVMHSCDNPPCCNPGHLSAGTRIDNNADAKAKGRHAHGVTNGSAKLTDPEIIAIRGRYADGETAVSLAKEYGVSDREIGGIARGEKWPHVGGRISPKRRPRKASGGAR